MVGAAIYCRVSTEEQHADKQKPDCIEFCKSKGYEIITIEEEKLSGFKNVERPKYEIIKELARRGEIKAVVVWALDGWVRNRDTLLEDVTILRNYGCKIHSVKEAWLEAINIEGPLGKTIQDFLLGLIGSLAEIESSRKSERVRMAFKNHKGKKWGRPEIHTNKKKIILELHKKGLSYRKIKDQTGLSIGSISEIINCSKKESQILSVETPQF